MILLRMACAKDLTVPASVLADALWHGNPSESAVDTFRTHMSHIRTAARRVAADTLFTTLRLNAGTSYRLGVDPDRIDVRRWETRLAAARERLLWESSRVTETGLAAVLSEWTGEPFGDALGWQFAENERKRLGDLRRNARLQLADLRIDQGRYRDVVADLAELTRERPGEFGLWERLVLSLWRSCQDDAAARACKQAICAFRGLGLDLSGLENLQLAVLRGTLQRSLNTLSAVSR